MLGDRVGKLGKAVLVEMLARLAGIGADPRDAMSTGRRRAAPLARRDGRGASPSSALRPRPRPCFLGSLMPLPPPRADATSAP